MIRDILEIVKQEYLSCQNIIEKNNKIYCSTWYRHDDCERLRELLFRITGDKIYIREQ